MCLCVCVQGGDAVQDQEHEIEDGKRREVIENQLKLRLF